MDSILFELAHSTIGLVLLFLVISCSLFYCWQLKSKLHIKRWQKSLNLIKHATVFNELYVNVDGFALSRKDRRNQDAPQFVYGEIEFMPFVALLSMAKPDKDTVFYDLGSGTGKAVIASALVYPVKKSVGIELFSQLYLSSCKVLNKLTNNQDYTVIASKTEFIKGDYFTANINDATMIFINSTALFGEHWEKLCKRLDSLPHLNTVITTSKPLLSTAFSMILSTKIEMSWGITLAYIYTRKTNFH